MNDQFLTQKSSLTVRVVWGSIPGPVKSDTVANGCDVFSELFCPDTPSGGDELRDSLHTLTHFREYNEDLIQFLGTCLRLFKEMDPI